MEEEIYQVLFSLMVRFFCFFVVGVVYNYGQTTWEMILKDGYGKGTRKWVFPVFTENGQTDKTRKMDRQQIKCGFKDRYGTKFFVIFLQNRTDKQTLTRNASFI